MASAGFGTESRMEAGLLDAAAWPFSTRLNRQAISARIWALC